MRSHFPWIVHEVRSASRFRLTAVCCTERYSALGIIGKQAGRNPQSLFKEQNLSNEAKCPFRHTQAAAPSNASWWPNQINLKMLHQNSSLSNPMEKDFNYAKEFKSLDLDAVVKDLHA